MRRVAHGLGALLLLAAILIGLPAVLLTVGADLLPSDLSITHLTRVLLAPDNTGAALVWLITLAAWIAWAIFVVLVVLETINLASGHRLNLHLPHMGGAQQFVGALIIAVVTIAGSPGAALAADHPGAPTGPAAAAPQAPATNTTDSHTVRPGDTLWQIAQDHYGDGEKYPIIAKANHISVDAVLHPGQKLTLPATKVHLAAAGKDRVTVGPNDSLWSLAETHLGDGHRWTELYKLNRDIIGTNPNLLADGLVLTMPAPKSAAAPKPKTTAAAPQQSTRPAAHTSPQPAPAPLPAPAPAPAPAAKVSPQSAPQATSAPEVSLDPTIHADTQAADGQNSTVRDGVLAGAGLVLASSLITTIGMRRRRQLRERRPGQTISLPDEDAQRLETNARAHAAPLTVERLNLVLRAIAQHCLDHGLDLPVLSAARLANDRIDLLLAQPADSAPDWVDLVADGSVWTILPGRSDDLPFQSQDAMEVAAPYPALVSIGHDDDNALILIDLESAGAMTIATSDGAEAESTIRAIALELALGPFAEDLNLTLVGDVCPGLDTALAEPTVTRVTDVDELLQSLTQRAEQQRIHLASTNTTVGQNRVQNTADGWDPEIILLGEFLTDQQVHDLAELLEELPRVAIAAVTTVEQNLSPWRLSVGGSPRTATLDPHNWQLNPLFVSDADYRNVLELLTTSQTGSAQPATWWDQDAQTELAALQTPDNDDTDDLTDQDTEKLQLAAFQTPAPKVTVIRTTTKPSPVRAPLPTEALTEALNQRAEAMDEMDEFDETPPLAQDLQVAPAAALIPPTAITPHIAGAEQPYNLANIPDPTEAHEAPMLRILGPVQLCNAAGTPGRAQRRCQETMLYMLEHPGCTTADLAAAFVMGDKTVKQNASYLRSWLGKDPDGNPYLPSGIGGYRLDPRVTTDWHLAKALLSGGVNLAPTDNLVQALNIIQGSPFEGVTSHAFAQAEMLRYEIVQSLVDAALNLVDRALETNDLALARWATSKALHLDPHSEAVAVARIRTEYQAGNVSEVDRLQRALHAGARAAQMDLCPETEAVLREVATR